MAKNLDQRLVTRYAKYHALKGALEKWLEKKRGEIIELLKGGARCPERGPYVLELGDAEARVSWKEEFQKWLFKAGHTEQQVENIFKNIERKPRAKDLRLYVKQNPAYRVKVVPRLPAA